MDHISDIKLIRTDTTLDLSQKAEKDLLGHFKGNDQNITIRCEVAEYSFDQLKTNRWAYL
ncbi:hypothetical protein YC2023_091199 [Brassica napus]